MIRLIYFIVFFPVYTSFLYAQGRSPLECLGYSPDTKLLIIHTDDLGMSHSENQASIMLLQKGLASSGSIMIPCPWTMELIEFAKPQANTDLGLHITLTSEWKYYKWGPVLSVNEVGSLVNESGYFYDNTAEFVQHAKLDEVEKEVKAQIQWAQRAGIDLTHLDTHMFSMAATIELAKLYIQISHEFNLPIPINLELAKQAYGVDIRPLLNEKDVILENIFMAEPLDYKNGLSSYYRKVLQSIKPGVSLLLIHPSQSTDELRSITDDHPDYGASWRAADLDFFSSPVCKKLLKKFNIQLIGWREIRDKCYRQ